MLKNCLYFILFFVSIDVSIGSLQDEISKEINNINGSRQTLSRKRRYLTFPEGSSFQLVYCLTLPSVGVGEFFTFGVTAAMAWELPTEPEDILILKGKISTSEAPTTTTELHHHYVDYIHPVEDHPSERIDVPSDNSQAGWTYRNELLQEPVRTYYNPFVKESYGYTPVSSSRSPVYEGTKYGSGGSREQKNNYFDDYTPNVGNDPVYYDHPVYHSIHRRTRRDLYKKIEKLLSALSKDGKSCVMKALCEVSQVPKGKGTFIEEILKTIFRIKPHDGFPDEDDYDKAANTNHNCTEQYPTCAHSVWTNMF
ncbi:unnamed protein product [Phaedon cochleariae]|uniref:Uncharacterized protein n=1 Tax=Phaedon cochleariae TaxID=80249 RepID=A0A9P0GL30_PHACE|nr:unnamed protein product [Phaedon cochleariae]